MTDSEAIAILERHRTRIDGLKTGESWSAEFEKWRRDTEIAIQKIFGEQSRHLQDFTTTTLYSDIPDPFASYSDPHDAYLHGLESACAVLDSMIDEIKQYRLMEKDMVPWQECLRVLKHFVESEPKGTTLYVGNIVKVCEILDIDELTAQEIGSHLASEDYIEFRSQGNFIVKPPGIRAIRQLSDQPLNTINNRTVFVVHGHNEALREAVARFLERLDLIPIILHEQPNVGRTIIEKFTDYSNVCYAVVLLTGDDMGGSRETSTESYQPRARQNVILELGFFLGKLGRDKVCALYERGVEIPSDYHGVLFIDFDESGAWRTKIAREIKASGVEIDLNKAM